MRTTIKEEAIFCLSGNFYPEHVVKNFLSYPQYKSAKAWTKDINKAAVLGSYIRCQDEKFFGHEEKVKKNQRKFFSINGVTPQRMSKFIHLNYLFLLDEHERTTDELLKKYYKALVCLNGGQFNTTYVVMERKKMQESVHRLQAKLIRTFLVKQPSKEVLKNFIVLSVLFSLGDLMHEDEVKNGFIELCHKVVY